MTPEHELQKACISWFRLQYPKYAKLLFAIPNGGKRNARVAARLKAEGVIAGVPDLFLAVSPYDGYALYRPGLFIELKSGKGRLTKHQEAIQKELREQFYKVEVVRNIDEFMNVVKEYLW